MTNDGGSAVGLDNYLKAYKKKMNNAKRGTPSPRTTHTVKGKSEPIQITNKKYSYGSKKGWNISAEVKNNQNREERARALRNTGKIIK